MPGAYLQGLGEINEQVLSLAPDLYQRQVCWGTGLCGLVGFGLETLWPDYRPYCPSVSVVHFENTELNWLFRMLALTSLSLCRMLAFYSQGSTSCCIILTLCDECQNHLLSSLLQGRHN